MNWNKRCGRVNRIVIGIAALALMLAGGAGAAATFFSDDFNGSALNSVWTVINKNSDSSISLTGTGYLRINASPKNSGSDYYNSSNYNAPRILQSISGIGFGYGGIIETKMFFSPADNYQGAGILLCSDDNPDSNTCIRSAERAFYPLSGGSVVRSRGTYVGYTNSTTYFRLMKDGTRGKGWFSSNGVDWILNSEGPVMMPVIKYVGLFAIRQPWDGDTNVYSRADFDYINIIVFNGPTLTVDDSGGADFTRIQDAIDNASAGDAILVYSGTYLENVNVNKQLSLQGIESNAGGKPVVDANSKDFGILINASGVTLEGFEIINSGIADPGAGIVVASNNNIIINNNALNNRYGIMLLNSSYSRIENNIASNNTRFQGVVNGPTASTGIIVLGSHNIIRNNNASNNFQGISIFSGGPDGSVISVNNTIEGNTVRNNNGITGGNQQPPSTGILIGASHDNIIRNNTALNNYLGILILGSNNTIRNNQASNNNFIGIGIFSAGGVVSVNNTITGNKANGNSDRGILLDNASNTTVSSNNASHNGGGILLVNGARNNLIINNIASNNSRWGIDLSHISTDNNILSNNAVNGNSYNGINLNYSNNNTITNNIASGNGWNGLSLVSSSNNQIYHNNLMNNANQAIDSNGTNFWDSGYPSGGNYWSDYTGIDSNNDSIGDTPYNISGGAQDRYPFIRWIFTVTKGDCSGDGKVDIVDALFIAQSTVGLKTFDPAQYSAADVSGDDRVDIVDALFIAQATVGLRIL